MNNFSKSQKRQSVKFVFDRRGNRVASVHPGGLLKRTIQNKHVLKSPPAIAFDYTCLRQMKEFEVDRLEVHNRNSKEKFRTTFDHFLQKAIDIDYGYGKQKALPLDDWTRKGPDGTQPRLF